MVTFLLVGPVRVVALKCGAVAWPRDRDVHTTPTPRWGGLAMFGGVLAGVGMAYQLPALRLAFDNNSPEVIGVLLATGLLCAVGALDDRYELDALTKFAGQITAAGVLVLFGVQWVVFWVPWGGGAGANGSFLILGQEQGVLLTVLLTVALVNAMNFVDGLDGLAAGIGLIAAGATGLFAIGLVQRVGNDPSAYSPALLAAVLAGACLGFLPHNFNPARIFMGDSGSMLIGLLLAAATTSESGRIFINGETGSGAGTDLLALFAPVVVLAAVVFVPLLDLLMAVVRRTRKGLSPVHPGQDAPAPPAAGDRAQPPARGAADLPVGRCAGLRRGRAGADRRSVRGALVGRDRAGGGRAGHRGAAGPAAALNARARSPANRTSRPE